MSKKIAIIGAGPGGLTAGMILAHRGFDVEIFEQNSFVGGRNGSLTLSEKYKFDLGPTFLLQKFTLDEMFEEINENSDKFLDFIELEPMYRLQYKDFSLDLSRDKQKMKDQIKKFFPGDEIGYEKFLSEQKEKFKKIFPVLQNHCSNLHFLLKPDIYKVLPYILNRNSLFEELKRYFKHEELCLAFTFQSKYLGMSPWNCPSLFTILSYIEHQYGIYHVTGGLSEISEVMAKLFVKNGGKLHLNKKIKSIIHENKIAKAIELDSGEKQEYDKIIINADFAYSMSELLGENLKKYSRQKLSEKEYSCSAFMLYLGLNKSYESLPHHTIIFADDYRKNVQEIMENKIPSEDMSIYIRNASINDKTLAPKGHSGLYILVPTINQKNNYDWSKNEMSYRQKTINTIEKKLNIKIENHIEAEKMITPANWERDFNVYSGAVFNLKHILKQMLYLRPRNRFECLKNCYLVGGGTHPGSGLPTIYESARISANLICDEYGVSYKKPDTINRFLN